MRVPYDLSFSILNDGTAYTVNRSTIQDPSINNFTQASVSAIDVMSGKLLWNFTLPANVTHTVVLNESNARYLMPNKPFYAMDVNKLTPAAWYARENLPYGEIDVIKEQSIVRLYPGKDSLYVNYWAYNYESPPFFGKANLTYTGGLFVLDKKGHLLWSNQTDSYITGVSEKNGTIFFSTSDGKFSATGASIAAGLFAAAVYILIRFLGLGTVSRARSRLETNDNRNMILKMINERPGPTLHEISRDTGLNIGTIRYHLLILSINHKITTYNDGTKFVRYFKNGNAYSEDQKLAISLMRRESMRKVLSIMIKNDAMTNQEISMATNMQESAVSKYLRELYTSGIIVKSSGYGEKSVYYVNNR
jgi:DNA-binding transcriptional ArsR family regulator